MPMTTTQVSISRMATSEGHCETSPYFDGWKEYMRNPYHPTQNRTGVIQMGLAENQLSYDLLEEWLADNPHALTWSDDGIAGFREIANYQDYHGLPSFRQAMASFMEIVRGNTVKFEEERIVLAAGATAASEVLTFCIADPGEAFLVPTPYYPGFDRDLKWRTGIELIPVPCSSANNFTVTEAALTEAMNNNPNVKIKGVVVTNPSNPLGTTLSADTLRMLLRFVTKHDMHLICDEIYAGTVFMAPRFVSIAEVLASLPDSEIATVKGQVHILYSLSKAMGLPGFRVGVIYSYNDAVVMAARRMSSFCLISTQTQHLIATALSDTQFVESYLAENYRRLRERHGHFVNGLRLAGIRCLPGNSGLFAWVDLREFLSGEGADVETVLWRRIVWEAGLNASPGSSCHCEEPGWFRFCFANMTEAETEQSLQRIQKLAQRLRLEKVCRRDDGRLLQRSHSSLSVAAGSGTANAAARLKRSTSFMRQVSAY